MTTTPPETWWTALSKQEQSRRKDKLARELETRGMDIPDSDYGWANAAYEAKHAGSVAKYNRGYRSAIRRTHLCCDGGELLEASSSGDGNLTFADHMCGFDPSQRCSC